MDQPLSGIYSAIVTPFQADESLDLSGIERLVDDQIAAGVAGLVVNGSTGEFPALTSTERQEVVEAVSRCNGGRKEIIVGLGSMRTQESIDHAEHALATGARAGLLVMPYYEPLSEDETRRFVADVAEVGLPLMLYNNPAGTGASMSPEFIASLSNIANVESIKDTTRDPSRLFAIQNLAEGRIQVLSGQDTSTFFALLTGRKAAVWGATNAHPTACVALWDLAVRDRNFDAALELWQALYPLNAFLESQNYAAATKAGANIRGVNVGDPRRPIQPLEGEAYTRLEQILKSVDAAVAALET